MLLQSLISSIRGIHSDISFARRPNLEPTQMPYSLKPRHLQSQSGSSVFLCILLVVYAIAYKQLTSPCCRADGRNGDVCTRLLQQLGKISRQIIPISFTFAMVKIRVDELKTNLDQAITMYSVVVASRRMPVVQKQPVAPHTQLATGRTSSLQ